MNATDTFTAPMIRTIIAVVHHGDLRQVGAALASTGSRTETARAELRATVERRERPRFDYPRPTASTPISRAMYRWMAMDAVANGRGAFFANGRAEMPEGMKPIVSPTSRVVYELPEFPQDTLEALKARAKQRVEAARLARVEPFVRAAYAQCGYRRAESTWAGGDHTVSVRLCASNEAPNAIASTSTAWSRNSKWKGSNSHHEIVVRDTWPVIQRSAQVVSSMLTLEMGGLPVESHIFAACWVEQGRGTGLAVRHGYLVDVGTNAVAAWKHADTLRGARRIRNGVTLPAGVRVNVEQLDATALLKRARLTGAEIITRATATDAGHCDPGIRDWINKRGDVLEGRDSITARELAELATASRDRVRDVYAVLLCAARSTRASKAALAPVAMAAE